MPKKLTYFSLSLVLVMLGSLLLYPMQATPLAQQPEGPPIYLQNRTLRPSVEDERALQVALDRLISAGSSQRRIHVLLQLDRIPSPQERAALARAGIDLQTYVPEQAWIASVPVALAATLSNRPGIRWAGLLQAMDKVSPRLQTGRLLAWVPQDDDQRVQVMVLLHADISLAEGRALVMKHQGQVVGQIKTPQALAVWIAPQALPALAAEDQVLWIEPGLPPLQTLNDGGRAALNVDDLHVSGLDGMGVNLFIYDGGAIDANHGAFGGRVTVIDTTPTIDHATHVAGMAAGDGTGSPTGRNLKGVAPAATIFSAGLEITALDPPPIWASADDLEADYALARNTYNIDLSSNSLGLNIAANSAWFDCDLQGDYGVTSSLLDGIVRGDNGAVGSEMIVVWANGNERGGSPPENCGSHFATMTVPACAKNPLQVGATNSDGQAMTSFSSWGPCDDGRLKPIVVGPGCESGLVTGEAYIYSTLMGNAYGGPSWCGTSSAAPAVAGVATLAVQHYRAVTENPNIRPTNALLKAWFIHTAQDLGPTGPDYMSGYGHVDAVAVMDLISKTTHYHIDTITAQSEIDSFNYNVPIGAAEFKATLVWDDVAATPIISNSVPALINNLDLEVVAPDGTTVYYPFSLDPAHPEKPATASTANARDNQEQVLIQNPTPGTWTIRVKGSTVPQGPQAYALVYTNAEAIHCSTGWLTNGDFESGNNGWLLDGASVGPAPAGGAGQALRLGQALAAIETATQLISIPVTATQVTLSYRWYMTTTEMPVTQAADQFQTLVLDPTSGAVLEANDLRSSAWLSDAWHSHDQIDLSSSAGQTITLQFVGQNDPAQLTTFYVDAVNLQVCVNQQPPVLTNPGQQSNNEGDSVTLSLSASDPDGDPLTFSTTGLPTDLTLDETTGQITGILSFDSAGSYTVTITVSDGLASDSHTFVWLINNVNRPPVLTDPGQQSNAEGESVILSLSASDPDGDPLTFSATGLPTDLTLDEQTGQISGSLSFDSAGSYTAAITVNDGVASDSRTFAWLINNVNRPPVLTDPGQQSNAEGESVILFLNASDPDGDPLTFSATGLPTDLTLDETTGQITGILSFDSAGSYSVTVSVSDGLTSNNHTFAWLINEATPPSPDFPTTEVLDDFNRGDGPIGEDWSGDTANYSIVNHQLAANNGDALYWNPTSFGPDQEVYVTLTTMDLNASEIGLVLKAQSSDQWGAGLLEVVYRPDIQVVQIWSYTPAQDWIQHGADIPLTLQVDDQFGARATVSEVAVYHNGLLLGSRDISAWPLASAGGYIGLYPLGVASLRFDDFGGGSEGSPPNQPPSLINPGQQNTDEGENVLLSLNASDSDGDPLTFSATGLPTDLTLNEQTGQISGSLSFDSAGSYTAAITVNDGVASDSHTFAWLVNNVNRPPVLTNPGQQSNAEGESVSLSLSASDPDGDLLSYAASGLPADLTLDAQTGQISGSLSFDSAGSYSVTIAVSDTFASDSHTFAWLINEGTPPSPPDFPTTGVLDDFNRSDGEVGTNWSGYTSNYSIANHQLAFNTGDRGELYWSQTSFGADQEVYVTLTTMDLNASEIGLILKAQSSDQWGAGLLEAVYRPDMQAVQIWSYTPAQDWIQHGSDMPLTLQAGDQFGARAITTGEIAVYHNGLLIDSRDISAWPLASAGGYIGLYPLGVASLRFDDFGGGLYIPSQPPILTNPDENRLYLPLLSRSK